MAAYVKILSESKSVLYNRFNINYMGDVKMVSGDECERQRRRHLCNANILNRQNPGDVTFKRLKD